MSNIIVEVRKTRKGWLGKNIKEVYLRDDILSGFESSNEGNVGVFPYDPLTSITIYFTDFETLFNQTDIIYNSQAIDYLIVLQSDLQKMRTLNLQKYSSFKNFVESTINTNRKVHIFADLYHKQIRMQEYMHDKMEILPKCVKWYQNLVKENNLKVNFIVLTSKYNEKLQTSGINTLSVIEFLKDKNCNLLDFLGFEESYFSKNQQIFDKHLQTTQSIKMIKQDTLFEGKYMAQKSYIKINRKMYYLNLINNRAIFGDVVAVQLMPTQKWIKKVKNIQEIQQVDTLEVGQANTNLQNIIKVIQQNSHLTVVGKVVSVIKRKTVNFCGSVNLQKTIHINQNDQSKIFQFLPVNPQYPSFYIRSFNPSTLDNKRIVIRFDGWPSTAKYPLCHYVRTIGTAGDHRAQADVILLQHNVQIAEFSKMAYACLPPSGEHFVIPEEEQKKRLDLRGINVVSIDPPGCKDIDDALHCIELSNGNYQVGVHIADVSYYVRPDTPLDLEARNRSTTVYLVDLRTDMLPKLLTQNLCSLRANVDRLVFSTIWELDREGNILMKKYCKSIIRSRRAFTYMEAQQLIDSGSTSEIAVSIRNLNNLAKKLKRKRVQNGALQLASTQVKVSLSEQTHSATDVQLYNLVETNSLIEQFMLLSNISVAEKIYAKFPALSILRRHSQPKPAQLETLRQILNSYQFPFQYQTSKQLANSLNSIYRKNDSFFNKLIRILTTRCMNQATYFCSADFDPQQFYHYGLAAPFYTHFTSPIRRYADILVHRLLAAAIDLQPLPQFMINKIK